MKKKTKITKALALALTLGLLCSGLKAGGEAETRGGRHRSHSRKYGDRGWHAGTCGILKGTDLIRTFIFNE